jgi:hypothetical protein
MKKYKKICLVCTRTDNTVHICIVRTTFRLNCGMNARRCSKKCSVKNVVLAIIIPKISLICATARENYVTSKSLYILINVDVICHLKTMTNVKFIHFLLLPQLLLHIVVHIRNWLCQQEKCIFRTSELRKKLDKFFKSTSKKLAKTTK